MATRDQVEGLLGQGHSYASAARELGIRPGLAYMIATGHPADGSEPPAPGERDAGGELPASSQDLVNPPPFNPTTSQTVIEWVRMRARRDLGAPPTADRPPSGADR